MDNQFKLNRTRALRSLAVMVALLLWSLPVLAHCDTMDGPVVKDAQTAIQEKNVEQVLKWVRPEDEGEIRELFAKTLTAREKSAEARELLDQHFFETLVRVHRAGEGAPYTGLKPAGTPIDAGIAEAEKALNADFGQGLVKDLQAGLEHAVGERLSRVVEAKKHADESVEAGREYVEAYVEYIHFVERLYVVIAGTAGEAHGADQAHEAADHTAHHSNG